MVELATQWSLSNFNTHIPVVAYIAFTVALALGVGALVSFRGGVRHGTDEVGTSVAKAWYGIFLLVFAGIAGVALVLGIIARW